MTGEARVVALDRLWAGDIADRSTIVLLYMRLDRDSVNLELTTNQPST